MEHYNQPQKRKAEFITPPNTLKAKVGQGGLSEDILDKAQKLLENNTVDFLPLGELYLNNLMKGIEAAKDHHKDDKEHVISMMLYPSMQLKANGGMFHYPLVTKIADKLIQFLEVIEEADIEAIEIVLAFHTTIRAVILGRITGDGGLHGQELLNALNDACVRYFDKSTKRR
ncbi:MAG: hypothetical protein ACLFR0_08420 [Alphaproteobacteria bacterium]